MPLNRVVLFLGVVLCPVVFSSPEGEWLGAVDFKTPVQFRLHEKEGALVGRLFEASSSRTYDLHGTAARLEAKDLKSGRTAVLEIAEPRATEEPHVLTGRWKHGSPETHLPFFAVQKPAATHVDLMAPVFDATLTGFVQNSESAKTLVLHAENGILRGESHEGDLVLNLLGDIKSAGSVALRETDDAGTLVGSFVGTVFLGGYFQGKFQDAEAHYSVPYFFSVAESVPADVSVPDKAARKDVTSIRTIKRHLKAPQWGWCTLAASYPQVNLAQNVAVEKRINLHLKEIGAATLAEEKRVQNCSGAQDKTFVAPFSRPPLQISKIFKTRLNSRGLLGLEFTRTVKTGALGDESSETQSVLIRLKDGQLLGPREIFVADWQTGAKSIAREARRGQGNPDGDVAAFDPKKFLVDEKGITFFLGEGKLASPVHVPFAELAPVLRKDGPLAPLSRG